MPIERRLIRRELPRKGFLLVEKTKHEYFYHLVDGRRTGMCVVVSRGTAYRTIDDSLLSSMKLQLKLDYTRQVRDLFECLMSGDEYTAHLKTKGVRMEVPSPTSEPARRPGARRRRRKRGS